MTKYSFQSVIFDLDGVITKTALVHAQAWKKTFDDYMRLREKRDGEAFREFTHENDYLPYVDGKPRYQGVKSFLESRNIHIPFGEPADPPDKETVCGVGNKKNDMFRLIIQEQGAEVYPSTIEFIKALHAAGIKVGVASSSKNCQLILQATNIEDLFETRVDGVVSAQLGLKGKPQGDIFTTAARNIGTIPNRSVVVEDATSGVAAGRNGGFGLVLGIARENNEKELCENGADLVVRDMAEINLDIVEKWFARQPQPLFPNWKKAAADKTVPKPILLNPYHRRSGKEALAGDKKLVFFLDYDGTLTPIVQRPELAVISPEMKETVKQLAKKHTVAVVSGRMREDVEKLVGIKGLFYAGSHGFDIVGPGMTMVQPQASETIPLVSKLIEQLKQTLGKIPGVIIEEKKFSLAVHYRLVEEKYLAQIKKEVEEIVAAHKSLRILSGKKVFEIMPAIDWDKGKAVSWIMAALKISWQETTVTYWGDDTTDEDAFLAVRTRGTGILVAAKAKASAAHFRVNSPAEVQKLFVKLIS